MSAQIVEPDGADDVAIQILDAHVDAIVAKAELVRLLARPKRTMREPGFDFGLAVPDVTTKKVPSWREHLLVAEMECDEVHEDLGDRPLVRFVHLRSDLHEE